MVEGSKKETKKKKPIVWFLFVIIAPLVIILCLITFILSMAGISVIDWAKGKAVDIPIVSNLAATDQKNVEGQGQKQIKDKLASKDEKIEQLKIEVRDLETTIEGLEHEMANLKEDVEPVEVDSDALRDVDVQTDNQLKAVAGSFKGMDSVQAALIIQNMEKETATAILGAVSTKVRGKILEAMEPKKAAELTQLIIDKEA
jgi:flagellar motility protein MotE (MotC chaperone)